MVNSNFNALKADNADSSYAASSLSEETKASLISYNFLMAYWTDSGLNVMVN